MRIKRSSSLLFAAALCLSLGCAGSRALAAGTPDLSSLRQVAQLPAELPQRVSSIAFDGEKIWVTIYLGSGQHAVLDPSTLGWEVGREAERRAAIADVSGPSRSPGGICFAGERLWVGGSYGDSLGYVNTRSWKVERAFKGRRVEDGASQVYSALACDGSNVWVAWHWFRYSQPVGRTQVLLKLDPETGQAVAEYPLPAGTRNDGTHGLTWDGARLWHMKGRLLSAIEPGTGLVTAQYELPAVRRASGLAWDGSSLWIAEFDGKIWRLSF